MTGAAIDRTGARALVRNLRDLGAPRQAERAVASGPQGHDLARAVLEILAPAELVLLHSTPASARARFRTEPKDLRALTFAEPESRDLILIGGGLETGGLASLGEVVRAAASLLRRGGVLAALIDTLTAPVWDGAADPFDALLFPHLAQQGALGEAAQTRAPLPAGAWILILQDAGLELISATAADQPGDLEHMMAEHATRLAVYDRQELVQGRLHVVARKPGGSA